MARHTFRIPRILAASLVVSSGFAAAADRDDHRASDAPIAATEPDAPATTLDTVEVTATRRAQPLREVPISVWIVDGETLDERGRRAFSDLLGEVPGLALPDSGFAGTQGVPVLRGIGGNIEFTEFNPLVAWYFGETPVTHPGGGGASDQPRLRLVDLERIEVLRGPQGTYFGANAMGGAVRFLPRAPEPGVRAGRVDATIGSLAHGDIGFSLDGHYNLPLGDDAAARVAAWGNQGAGFIDDPSRGDRDVDATNTGGARAAVRFVPDRWTIDATLWSQRDRIEGFRFEDAAEPDLEQSREIDEGADDRWALAQFDVDYDAGDWHATANLSGFHRDVLQSIDVSVFLDPLPVPLTARNDTRVRDATQELRIATRADARFGGMLGLFHQHRRFDFDQDFPAPGLVEAVPDHAAFGLGDNLFRLRSETTIEQSAVYGDAWWRPADAWELSAGVRWLDESRRLDSDALGALGNGRYRDDASFEGTTPRVALRRSFGASHAVYASATKGYRGGGFNDATGTDLPACRDELAALGFDAFPRTFLDDSLWSYELGTRSRWDGGRITLDGALFHVDWDEVQTDRVLECIGLAFRTNEGGARSRGAELDFRTALGASWRIGLTLTYTDAQYVAGAFAGERVPGVPRLAGTATIARDLGGPGSFVEARVRGMSTANQALGGGESTEIGSYALADVAVVRDFGDWQGSVRIENLFDRRARIGASDNFLRRGEVLAAPRAVVAGFTVRF